jgi:hypothetical protein
MRYQPQGLMRLDRRNPLARGLTFIKSVPGSANPATLGSAAPSGAMPAEVKLQGLATRFSGYGTPVIDTNVGQTAQGTVLVLHQSTILPPSGGYPNPGYCHVLAATASGNTVANGWLLMLGNGTGNLQFRAYDGADNGTQVVQADGSTPLNDGKPHVSIGTWDFSSGGVLQTYVDGAPYAVSGAIPAAITIVQPMRLGRDRASLQFWGVFDGNMYMSMVWNRILSPAEIRSISVNPWQLFESPDEEDFRVSATAYTLAAAPGALGITGQAASLKSARRCVGATGAVAANGSDARMVTGRRLGAASSVFALTPMAAAIRTARKLIAATGSTSWTGAGAGLRLARRLPGASASAALSGGAGSLVAARLLTAQSAAIAFTAGPVTFTYTPKLGGQGPTYTLSGGPGTLLLSTAAARLLLARRMVSMSGVFSATGVTVVMRAARRLTATAGVLTLAGAPGGLRAARRLPAALASFSLTSGTATFLYTPITRPGGPTYTLAAVGGALGLVGTGVGIRARRRMTGSTAQFFSTGWDVHLTYGQKIVYARAPAGSGYTPHTAESQHRPTGAATTRPGASQRNNR